MRLPNLPSPILNLQPGELVYYRWWSEASIAWITDGVPHLVVSEKGGIADVLLYGRIVRIPTSLLKRVDNDHHIFANLV